MSNHDGYDYNVNDDTLFDNVGVGTAQEAHREPRTSAVRSTVRQNSSVGVADCPLIIPDQPRRSACRVPRQCRPHRPALVPARCRPVACWVQLDPTGRLGFRCPASAMGSWSCLKPCPWKHAPTCATEYKKLDSRCHRRPPTPISDPSTSCPGVG